MNDFQLIEVIKLTHDKTTDGNLFKLNPSKDS